MEHSNWLRLKVVVVAARLAIDGGRRGINSEENLRKFNKD